MKVVISDTVHIIGNSIMEYRGSTIEPQWQMPCKLKVSIEPIWDCVHRGR